MRKILYILICLALFSPAICLAQTVVSGHVQDISGLALIGATISEDGTDNIVISDLDGDFKIKLKDAGKATLCISYIGMEEQRIEIKGQDKIIVTLKQSAIELDQVIVTGYGNIAKEAYTGSAEVVSAQKIEDRAIGSVDELIRANVSGALSSSSGQPGESSSVLLRGFGSMNASNNPIYVIDGVVWDMDNVSGSSTISSNPLNSLNPSDIASLTVLKDAASASLYGSRGANGVVVITTKKGVNNENLRVSLSTHNGVSMMNYTPDLLDGRQFADLWVEGQMHALIQSELANSVSSGIRAALNEQLALLYADKQGYKYADKSFYDWQAQARADFNAKYMMPTANGEYMEYDYFGADKDKLPSSDWFKAISRVAPFSKTNLTLRGGTSYIAYYASMEYFNQQGSIINSELERYALRLKLNSDRKDDFINWGLNLFTAYTGQSGPNAGGSLYNSPQYAATILPPVVPIYIEDGSYNFYFPDNLLNSNHNPVASARLNINKRPSINLNLIGNIKLNFATWLNLQSVASIYYQGYRRKTYYDSHFGSGYSTNGSLTERDVHKRKISNTTTLNINKEWRNRHNLNATIGVELEDYLYTYTSLAAQGFGDDKSPYLTNAANLSSFSGDGYSYGMFSLITRADYGYKSKYHLAASFRRDYSSMFAPGYRAGNFWSVSGAYDLSKENFMRKYRRRINSLKFKVSYGVNGTLPSQYYYWQNSYATTRYTNELGAYSSYRYRPELSWEGNMVWNVGADAALLRNRLEIGIEYYRRVSKDLLQDVKVSMASGYATMLQNTDAGIDNSGIELNLRAQILQKGDWSWDIKLNATKMKSVYYGLDSQYLDSYQRQIVANGVNVHSWYLRRYAGIDEKTGLALYEAIDEGNQPYLSTSSSEAPYYAEYQGVPKILGGLNSSLKWKNLQLDILCSYGLGHYIYNRTGAAIIANDGATHYSMASSQLDRWTPDHTKALNPLRINGSALSTRSTRYLVKGDYIKLKNVKLSYRVPQKLTQKISLSYLSLYLQAENACCLSYIPDYDPEISVSGYRFPDLYPTSSIYTLGINIRF